MTVLRIGYIEIYASDRGSLVKYFSSALGFAETAHARTRSGGSTLLGSTLLQRGDVRLIVSDGAATEDFLERHGDGVADVAFVCDDVEAVRVGALRAGAQPVGPDAVSAFGAVWHTLLPASAPDRPIDREWATADTDRDGHIKELDHIAVCLDTGGLPGCVAYYLDGFGFERYSSEFIEVGNQAMDSVVVRNGPATVTFTLLEPVAGREAGQLDAFLARNGGAGVQHLAFRVEEIVPAVRDFREAGVDFLHTPGAYYDALTDRLHELSLEIADLRETNVLADRDEWGYLLQLFSRSPHPRNTLFYELIQRRGARGFGSANIRALYEAVERDRSDAE